MVLFNLIVELIFHIALVSALIWAVWKEKLVISFNLFKFQVEDDGRKLTIGLIWWLAILCII